jgi:serine kinase of HPr protein (carbohydrate metabolism regulator)
MKVEELIKALNLTPLTGDCGTERLVSGGYTCDLLSDVMGNSQSGQVWITQQTHKNVMAVASLRDLAAVIIVKGLKPNDDMLEQAIEEKIPVLGTYENGFDISGKLYKLLEE